MEPTPPRGPGRAAQTYVYRADFDYFQCHGYPEICDPCLPKVRAGAAVRLAVSCVWLYIRLFVCL